jgi:hypothetical protein
LRTVSIGAIRLEAELAFFLGMARWAAIATFLAALDRPCYKLKRRRLPGE